MTVAMIPGERIRHIPSLAGPNWEAPDKTFLGTGRKPAPAFPTALLGQFWRDWTERTAAEACGPTDYVATALLCGTGVTLGNARWPAAVSNWKEPPILWAGLIGNPGQSKSPCMEAVRRLLRRAEEDMSAGFDEQRRAYAQLKEEAEAAEALWKAEVKTATKSGDLIPLRPNKAEPPQEPVRPRLVVADSTTEKLGLLAAGNPRGLLMYRDELAGWWSAFDRYGGSGADRTFFIEAFGGRPYSVDRVKTPDPIQIRHLTIGVLGGVQPDRLADMVDGADDGLVPRFLWTWPDSSPEFRIVPSAGPDHEAEHAFRRLVALQMEPPDERSDYPTPRRVPLSAAATDALQEFGQYMQNRARDATGPLAGTFSKARGHALRLSAILEFLWWSANPSQPEPVEISEEAVSSAAGLLDGYYLPMAQRVFGDAALPKADRNALALIRYLRSTQAPFFNAKNARREIGNPLRSAGDMDTACAALVEACLIRPVFERAGDRPGRVRKDYEVNPIVVPGAAT